MTARAARDGPRVRGLPSLSEARAERRRAIALGRVRLKGISHRFWLWAFLLLGPGAVVYWRTAQVELQSGISQVMAKQRAVVQSLGPRILPFRDNVERWVHELAGPWTGDQLVQTSEREAFVTGAGVYLRLGIADAKDSASIRRAAIRSLRDGFSACLFAQGRAADETSAAPCRLSSDCPSGLLCSELGLCSRPSRPYNMRLAYRALRVLSTDWTDELHQAGSDLLVKAFDRDLDSVVRTDVPVAIEVLVAAKFLTVVLDEAPEAGLPDPVPDADESDEERVQRADHWARVGTWDLKANALLWKLRRRATGRFIPVGTRAVRDPVAVAAQQRQANNCALAGEVQKALKQPSEPP